MPSHAKKTKAPSTTSDDSLAIKMKRSRKPPQFDLTALSEIVPPHLKPKIEILKKNPRRKYYPGYHGYKTYEQKRLKGLFNETVSGKTHESEHPIGFEPINQTSEIKRGKSARSRGLENLAPAYQEEHDRHRDHIGTCTHGTPDESGFNSHTYRNSQRELLMQNEPGVAIQLNQLGYAFDQNFKFSSEKSQWQSNNSFEQMAREAKSFDIADDYEDKKGNHVVRNRQVTFKPNDYQEMLLSRTSALLKRYPNEMERSILQTVVQGKIDFNYFLYACKTGDFAKILKELGLSDLQEDFDKNYLEHRKSDKFKLDPKDNEEPDGANDVEMGQQDRMDVD